MKKDFLLLAYYLTLTMIFMSFGIAYAAPGDIIFQCNFEGTGSSPVDIWSRCGSGASASSILTEVGSIGSGDGPNGKYLKIGVNNWDSTISQYAVDAPFWVNKTFPKEITIVYWEKIDSNTWPIPTANIKSIRQHYGSEYMGALIALHYDNYLYQSFWENQAKLVTTNKVTTVDLSDGYCTENTDGSYACPVRMRLKWTPNYTDGKWHKVRLYLKMPSGEDTTDGQTKVWMDEQLVYTLSNLAKVKNGVSTSTNVTFAPSDAGGVPYNHSYDEITIYDGYVPGNSDGSLGGGVPPSPPASLRFQ